MKPLSPNCSLVELEEFAQSLAHGVSEFLKRHAPGVGFTLFLIQHQHPGWSTYVSSFQREGMLIELEEFLQRMKEDPASIENPRNEGIKPEAGPLEEKIYERLGEFVQYLNACNDNKVPFDPSKMRRHIARQIVREIQVG